MIKKKSRIEVLKRAGWTRQFTASEPRLSEAVEMYTKAGFEVHLEPLPTSEEAAEDQKEGAQRECRQCFQGLEDQYKIIFTRSNKNGSSLNDELFE